MKLKVAFSLKSILVLTMLILGSLTNAKAQNNSGDSLVFSINDTKIYKTEFLNQYHKNSQSSFQDDSLSMSDYAEMYLRFKLKVVAAKKKGFDTMPEFIKEFKTYRKQLADKYISNGKVTEEMVNETYHRMTNEVNVSHILITLKPDANPADTLNAYNSAIDILKKIQAGEPFEELAVKYSKDPSVKVNKGSMGWFKAYKMVYPFETAAYNLKVGEVSEPVRTQFGYHIIKKNDERPSKGQLKVAHIMKNLKTKDSTYNAEEEIQKIYQKLQNGEDFSDLANQFSDHKATSSKGGELSPFSVGQLNSAKFEEVAFNLDKNNSLSKPFKTQFGWHIVKYLDNIPVEPLDQIKSEIIKKIKTSNRSKRLIDNIKKDLMTKYEVSTNYEVLSVLEDRIDESIVKYKWKYEPKDEDDNTYILKIDDEEYMLEEFLNYIQNQQRILEPKTLQDKINMAIDKFTYAKLIKIHNQNLEKVSPKFAAEIKTYYEGLLLFDIMEDQIWEAVQKDSIALKDYYEANPSEFMSKKSIDAVISQSSNKKVAKKIKRQIASDSLTELKKKYPQTIFQTLNQTDVKSPKLPENLNLKTNKPKIYKHNGQFICILITQVYPSKLLDFNEVRGKVINILQKEREEQWIDELKQENDIFINHNLVENLQQQFEN